MHVVTPVPRSVSGVVVAGSQVAGGNIGTQVSPCSSVNGPHRAALTVSPGDTQLPLRSVVPDPQSTALQLGVRAASSARRTLRGYMRAPRSGRRPGRGR